ncbi:uncharacterized protein LOC135373551 [Ornithodoros turicata]|uniref:uncharacterized protein LOC135373551 n=1 Tax=Ornithodoros turicata TaxID=34597 RepID=UPI003139D0A4
MKILKKHDIKILSLVCIALGAFLYTQMLLLPLSRSSLSGQARPPETIGTGGPSTGEAKKFLVNTSSCSIPDIDPFDASIKRFYAKKDGRLCPDIPSFVQILNHSIPTIQEARLRDVYGLSRNNISCTYREIYRNESVSVPDAVPFYKDTEPLVFDMPLITEYGHIKCFTPGGRMFHEEFVLVPILKPTAEKRLKGIEVNFNEAFPRLNVLVLGMDSVSRINFNRHLPRSGKFVRDVLRGFELFGYNKVGRNSFPNQTPLLTGLSADEAKSMATNKFFDDLPFVWKEYKKQGYSTLFLEETPKYGLYTCDGKGFKHSPTDYYPRHVVQAVDRSYLKRYKSVTYCVGPKLPMTLYLEYLLGLIDTWKDQPFFAYAWMSELAHNDLNTAGLSDSPFLDFLRALYDRGVLNNTVVAFMSDHGLRFGSFRNTYVGWYEDNLPFAFLLFPDWFLERYPQYAKALETNQRRLTTHYDMHATLLQMCGFTNMKRTDTKRGLSLFYEVPENRTCAAASIPDHLCTCLRTSTLPRDHPLAHRLASFVLNEVNRLVQKEFSEKCEGWSLKDVVSVYRLHVRDNREHKGTTTHYRINIAAFPGGLFEAAVSHTTDRSESSFAMSREPDRIDMYAAHADCVRANVLAKYCYCKLL